jgi:hypothetical protein
VDGALGDLGVVGGAAGPDVVGSRPEVGPEAGPHAVDDLGHRVGLGTVPVGVVHVVDGPGGVEEGVGVDGVGRELELVGHVLDGVTVVVDVDLVQHVVAELVVVRAATRLLDGDEVGDEADGVGVAPVDEGIDIGVVGYRILGDGRCFPVTGGVGREHEGGGDDRSHPGDDQGATQPGAADGQTRGHRETFLPFGTLGEGSLDRRRTLFGAPPGPG